MFKNRKRVRAAWLRGLMFGRALGAKQERERIVELLESNEDWDFTDAITLIEGEKK